MENCQTCGKELSGRQTKFCCVRCKNVDGNNKNQNYKAQQKRGLERRAELIDLKGGCCQTCGYCKNNAALAFHHRNPEDKEFQIDLRKCSNCSWERLLSEADKCDLLCCNCHAEVHFPDMSK